MKYVKLNVEPCVRDSLWDMARILGLPMTEILKILTVELKDVVTRMLSEYVKYRRLGIPATVEVSVKPREDILRLLGTLKREECVEVSDLTQVGKVSLPKCIIIHGKRVRVFQGVLLEYPQGITMCAIDVDVISPTEYELQHKRLSLCRCIGVIPWWHHREIREVVPPEEVKILDELWSTASNEDICRELEDPERWFNSDVRKKMLGDKVNLPRYNWLEIVIEIIERIKEKVKNVLGNVELAERKTLFTMSLMLGV